MIRNTVLRTIKTHRLIEEHQHIVLGLSGGPDSVCLFSVLLSLAGEMDLTIHPVHVNHQLRPEAAEADQQFVEALCRQAGCPAEVFVFDCGRIAREEKLTGEEAGRKIRYGAFAQVAQRLVDSGICRGDISIAVAQNADDQAETILFRLLRGTGTDGLAGIAYSRQDEAGNRIIRPLLDVYKQDILEYCRANHLQFCQDHTNSQTVYMRNRLRLQLIPQLEEEYNPKFKDTLIRMGKTAAQDSDFLWTEANRLYCRCCKSRNEGSVLLDGAMLKQAHGAVLRRVLALALSETGLREDLTYAHYAAAMALLDSDNPSARVDLPKGYCMERQYENLKIGRTKAPAPGGDSRQSGAAAVAGDVRHFSGEEGAADSRLALRTMTIGEYNALRDQLPTEGHAAFDADAMGAAFGTAYMEKIRMDSRKPGDYLPLPGGKSKKIQDYLVDCKVPKGQRDGVRLVKLGNEVLWIPPQGRKGRYSANYKLCEKTKNVICIEIICDI